MGKHRFDAAGQALQMYASTELALLIYFFSLYIFYWKMDIVNLMPSI